MILEPYPVVRLLMVWICVLMFAVGIEARGQDQPTNTSDTERIYRGGEVDKKAVIVKVGRDPAGPSPRGCKGQNLVIIGAVLRKSGKVTNVKVLKPGNCPKFEKRAIQSVEKTKFKPAKKAGAPVSTYMSFEFNYNCKGECP